MRGAVDTRKARRLSSSVVTAVSFALAFALAVVAPRASAQNAKVEAAAKALQKEAIEKHYLSLDFPKALATLDKAVTQCGTDKCSAALRAALRRDQGVIHVAAGDKDKGIASFVEAIKIDPNVALDPDLKNADNQAAFDAAKKQAGGGGTGPAAPSGQPSGDFTHTPAAEQQIRTPIPIYAEYAGEEQLTKVIVRYKGFGMTEWKSVELKKMGDKGWGGQLPCADIQQGTTQYYIQGFDANNDPVATAGDRNNPYKVPVKREKVDEPPHLPGQPPPTQCADTGDCPPNFPGCKKAGPVTEGPTGKEGGEYCEEDSECKSNKCESSKCTEPKKASKGPRVWVGIWGAFDYSFLPSADNVCKLKSTKENQEPVNDANYYCVQSDGSDYPYRLTSPGDTNPRGPENSRLVLDQSDKVSGGGAFGNIRVMASIDYAATMNVLIGARLGYVLNGYPGQAGKDDGKTFPPIHVEVRGTYLIGQDALAQKFAPYVFAGGGVSTWDASVKVSVVEQDPATAKKTPKDVDAWHIGGPAFIVVGGGARIAFSPRAALMAGLRVNFAFGNSFAPSTGPEVGVVFGF